MRELTVSKKSIGIDIGSHSIKAGVAARRGSSVIVKSLIEIPISRSDAAQNVQVAQAVEELGKRLKIGSEMVVTSVSTQQATVRNLEIPFSEEEKARQILKFQTEPYLAFPIEEVIIDFYDTRTAPEGKMKVLLTAIHKGVIGNLLEILSRAEIDPEVVDVDFMAVASAALRGDTGLAEKGGIVIDIGNSKTIACYIQEGKLLAVRCLPLGGEDFTEAISKALGVSFEEAERIKTNRSAPNAPDQEKAERLSGAVGSVLDRLGAELDRTLRYFSSQVRGANFDRVFLCGGSASLQGLDRFLAESLSADVSLLSPSDTMKIQSGEEIPFPRFATAVGLALRGLGEAPCLQNFRQEEHAYGRPLRRLRKSLAVSGGLVLSVAALLVFSLFGSIDRYSSKRRDLDFLIQTKRSTIFPDKTPKSKTEMEKLLEDEKSKLTPFRELRGNLSIIRVLEDLSTRVPKEIVVELSLFNYTKSRPPELPRIGYRRRIRTAAQTWAGIVTVRGTVSTVADHVRLKEILEALEYVGELEDKGTSPAPNGRLNVEYILKLSYPGQSRARTKEASS